MNARTRLIALLFGPGRPPGALFAPGDADCRWRALAAAARDAANDSDVVGPPAPPRAADDAPPKED
jgi:hypothetical protein